MLSINCNQRLYAQTNILIEKASRIVSRKMSVRSHVKMFSMRSVRVHRRSHRKQTSHAAVKMLNATCRVNLDICTRKTRKHFLEFVLKESVAAVIVYTNL